MDMKKFCDKLTQVEAIKDIPLTYIFRVAFAVFEVINEGDCFLNDEREVYGVETLQS